jgi:phenylalanyl-tRNA synthetase beta chain
MTILTLNKKEFEKKVGKLTEALKDKITEMGTPIDGETETELMIEVFPNRPDLLSLQAMSRAILEYTEKSKTRTYTVEKPEKDFVVNVDKSVRKVRPYTVCAIVKGLKLDEQRIQDIIDIQEKLHLTIGRKRKKLAIGVYPLEKIKLPISYEARKPSDIKFQPLESQVVMTAPQILRQHPTGIEYADLLKGAEVYPVFVDANNKILSMPPIINSNDTGRVSNETKDVFIECSGFNLHYLNKTLNIIVTALADMGGKIYSMKIKGADENYTTPNLESEKLEFKLEDLNKTLGTKFTEKQIKNYLERMGLGLVKEKNKTFASIPAWRTDILHWIDLTEEVAIAHGYENFIPEIPEISTIGEESKQSRRQRMIGNILAGIGLLEVSTFHLTTKENIKKMHYNFTDFIEIEESKNENDALRVDLLTNSLKVLSENSDSQYPQKIFEVGTVFELDKEGKTETGIKESERLAISLIDEKISFTDSKQVLDYLFKMLDKEYELEVVEDNNYILGRVGKVLVNKKEVGRIGEVAPRVLKNWKINLPVSAIELDLSFLD